MAIRIVIPARLESTRLPRKLLLDQTGQTLLQHTYEAASQSKLAQSVVVATDSNEILEAVQGFGGIALMTSAEHNSGTDRIAEVASRDDETELFVNVQGDEPEISGESIDTAIRVLQNSSDLPMATLAAPIISKSEFDDPSCVKVVLKRDGTAMYFSRAAIPHAIESTAQATAEFAALKHLGLYVYRREFLLQISSLPSGELEKRERLEQLRVLEAGYSIGVGIIDSAHPGIDTPEDYRAFVSRINK